MAIRRQPPRKRKPEEPDGSTSPPLEPPLEDLAAPAWLVDRKGAVLGANRAARALEAAAGRPLPLTTPSARELFAEGSELLRACEEGRPVEVCVRGPECACRSRLALEPLRGTAGTPLGALLLVTETGNTRPGRSFHARVLATAARELGNPIASLRHFHQLARRAANEREPDRVQLYLERVERQVQRIDYLVGELHDLVEHFSGQMPFSPLALDLADEVRAAVDAAATADRRHVFEISGPDEAIAVFDRTRIRGVLAALLSNAARFSPAGGRVHVELSVTPRAAEVAVTDPGPGMSEERLAQLFDGPCQNAESHPGGLGLGLYLAREAVELHGGTIRAEHGPDAGTRVVVTLPRIRR